MLIGVPKEIKIHEYRVAITAPQVAELVACGHEVLVQEDAGTKAGFTDTAYRQAGAILVRDIAEAYRADMVVKVKEPQPVEIPLLREGQILFTFLHLAPDAVLTQELLKKKIVGIAYETVIDRHGKLPLLTPMSEIAGRLAVQMGANYLQMNKGGKGIVLGGVPGVKAGRVCIIGGGIAGTEAARIALGMGAEVLLFDLNLSRLRVLDSLFGPRLTTLHASSASFEEYIPTSDLVIGAVLVPGQKAPKLLSRKLLARCSPGTVFIDISIDQGGCAEMSRPTNHDEPTYIVDGVIYSCVANIPGACARTATLALTNATGEYVFSLANNGWKQALKISEGLKNGLNVCHGHVTHAAVAADQNLPYISPEMML